MKHLWYVYALEDPEDGTVRYVGQTPYPKQRLRQHLAPNSPGTNEALNRWKTELQERGVAPQMRILCTIEAFSDGIAIRAAGSSERSEIRWWARYNRFHDLLPLLNIAGLPKQKCRQVALNGKTQSMAAWDRDFGISRERVRQRLAKYPPEVALITPRGEQPNP